MKILTVSAEVKIPHVPNFLLTTGGMTMPLSAFTDEGLRGVAEEWTKNLLERAKEQREDSTEDLLR